MQVTELRQCRLRETVDWHEGKDCPRNERCTERQ